MTIVNDTLASLRPIRKLPITHLHLKAVLLPLIMPHGVLFDRRSWLHKCSGGQYLRRAVTSNSSTPDTTNRFLIFPNSQSNKGQWGGDGSSNRTTSYPLQPGDFVQLPMITRGKQLELFLMGNLNSTGVPEATYYNQKQQNGDGLLHMVAFFPANSNFVILGFETSTAAGTWTTTILSWPSTWGQTMPRCGAIRKGICK